MLKKTRRRLTILLTAITGAVLVVSLFIAMRFMVDQKKADQEIDMLGEIEQIVADIVYNKSDGFDFLKEVESKNNLIIEVEDKDGIVDREYGYDTKTDPDKLMKAAREKMDAVLDNPDVYQNVYQNHSILSVYSVENGNGIEFQYSADDADNIPVRTEIIEDVQSDFIAGYASTAAMLISTDVLDGVSRQGYVALPVMYYNADGSGNIYMHIDGDDDDGYTLFDLTVPTENDYNYNVKIIKDNQEDDREISLIYLMFFTIMAGGLIMLAILNRMLSGMVLRPAKESMEKQKTFIASASHELRSPLAVIRSSLEAAEVEESEEESLRFYKNAHNETVRMGRLVDDLLILAGSDTKKWKIEEGVFDLDTLMIEIAENYENIFSSKNKKLVLNLPEDTIGEVKGDKDRVKQILGILLDNASEYAPENTEVSINAEKGKSHYSICVIDHGKGVPDDEKAKVFERFYRADESRTDKKHFGLGLAVAREIAELINGKISVYDTEGGGATFKFKLPY